MVGRVVLSVCTVVLLAGASFFSAPASGAATSGDWPQFRYGPEHTGENPYESVLSPATVPGLSQAWAAPEANSDIASPTVVDGVVYIGSGYPNGSLYALDAADGSVKWISAAGGFDYASPAVVDGVVYAASRNNRLYAMGASTGGVEWTSTIGYVTSAPSVAHGILYLQDNDRETHAFDAATGLQLWTADVGGFGGSSSSPAVADGTVYVQSADRRLYALDAGTGAVRWSAALGEFYLGSTSPTVAGGMVYAVTDHDKVYAFDASTGEPRWTSPATVVRPVSTPAVAGGMLFVGSTTAGCTRWMRRRASSDGPRNGSAPSTRHRSSRTASSARRRPGSFLLWMLRAGR